MKRIFQIFLLLMFAAPGYGIADHTHNDEHPENISYYTPQLQLYTPARQAALANSDAWLAFRLRNGEWNVQFDERNGKPHRAYGKPVAIQGATGDAATRAIMFLNNELGAYTENTGTLLERSTRRSAKYEYVDFVQHYAGLEVLNSRAHVRMTREGKVVMFGLELYDDIVLDTRSAISAEAAGDIAAEAVAEWERRYVRVHPELKILPIPLGDNYTYRLVYEVEIRATRDAGEAVWLYTLVDAHSGDIQYRANKLHSVAPQAGDVEITGTLHRTHPQDPARATPLANLRVRIDGRDYYTDAQGVLVYGGATPVQATAYLEGKWAKVIDGDASTNAVSPNFNFTLGSGLTTVSFDNQVSVNHISGYYHTNLVHDFVKELWPDFTALDVALPVRVDRSGGACNAFYDGASINFFRSSSQCYSFASVGSIVYHEYGHALTHEFYGEFNLPFSNGAMGEGYSDVLAMAIIKQGIIGQGSTRAGAGAVRQYSESRRKVYPQDIIGEVHADGEIIAGAWWDLARLLNSYEAMTTLFAESLYGLANGPNGDEGRVYSDILLDVLLADDDNGNLADGSPNMEAIIEAFALHGITLRGGTILHDGVDILPADKENRILVNTELPKLIGDIVLRGDIVLKYRTDNGSGWTSVVSQQDELFQNSATLPALPAGTVVQYYFELESLDGTVISVDPPGANLTGQSAGLPYFALIGYKQLHREDFDSDDFSDWTIGVATDDASSGAWEIGKPNATFFNGTPVQTGFDNTGELDDSNICAFTGNTAENGQAGANDVDDGETTLLSPVFDLRTYKNPAFTYFRWFSNDAGANPGNDPWEVFITADGQTWQAVENTRMADASWRRNAFRVLDYMNELTASVQLRFVASDRLVSNAPQNGGSLVEAAVDDLTLYDIQTVVDPTSVDDIAAAERSLQVYPNPVHGNFTVVLPAAMQSENAELRISDLLGITRFVRRLEGPAPRMLEIPAGSLAPGVYIVSLSAGDMNVISRISVLQ